MQSAEYLRSIFISSVVVHLDVFLRILLLTTTKHWDAAGLLTCTAAVCFRLDFERTLLDYSNSTLNREVSAPCRSELCDFGWNDNSSVEHGLWIILSHVLSMNHHWNYKLTSYVPKTGHGFHCPSPMTSIYKLPVIIYIVKLVYTGCRLVIML